MKYVKKPIPVEAFCPAEDETPLWFMREGVSIEYCEDEMIVSVPTYMVLQSALVMIMLFKDLMEIFILAVVIFF